MNKQLKTCGIPRNFSSFVILFSLLLQHDEVSGFIKHTESSHTSSNYHLISNSNNPRSEPCKMKSINYRNGWRQENGGIKSSRSKQDSRLQYAYIDVLPPLTLDSVSNAYSYALGHYQIETQSLSTGLLSGLGDTIAQLTESPSEKEKSTIKEETPAVVENSLKKIEMQRTFNFVLKGLGAGIIWHFWYNIADSCGNLVFGYDHETTFIQRTILAIMLEQFIAAPVVYSLWDIPVPALLNGAVISSIPQRVRTRLGDLLFSNAKVWTFANAIIYNVPVEWRVLAMNFADLGWQVVMSKFLMAEDDENDTHSEVKDNSKSE